MMPVPLISQVVRALRRKLTPDEVANLERAQGQGYNTVGWRTDDFTYAAPRPTTEMGESAAVHLDLTPTGSQALARKVYAHRPKDTTELIVARLNNPAKMSDMQINNLRKGEKAGLQSSGSTGAIYPNSSEMATIGGPIPKGRDPMEYLINSDTIRDFIHSAPPTSNLIPNPSAAIFNPADVRRWNARFDPKMVGKPGWMAGVGAGSVMTQPSAPEPTLNEDLPLESVGISGPEAVVDIINALLRRK